MRDQYEPDWHLRRGHAYLAMIGLTLPLLLAPPVASLFDAARTGVTLPQTQLLSGAGAILAAMVLSAWCAVMAVQEAQRIDCAEPLVGTHLRWLAFAGASLAIMIVILAVAAAPVIAGTTIDQAQADAATLALYAQWALGALVIAAVATALWRLEMAVRIGTESDTD